MELNVGLTTVTRQHDMDASKSKPTGVRSKDPISLYFFLGSGPPVLRNSYIGLMQGSFPKLSALGPET